MGARRAAAVAGGSVQRRTRASTATFCAIASLPALRERWPAAARSAARSTAHLREARQAARRARRRRISQARRGRLLPDVARSSSLAPARRRNVLRHWIRQQRRARAVDAQARGDRARSADGARRIALPCVDWDDVRGAPSPRAALLHRASGRRSSRLTRLDVGRRASRLSCQRSLGRLRVATRCAAAAWRRRSLRRRCRFASGTAARTLQPAGDAHHRKLKKLLQDAGVLPWWRDRLPLIYAGERLVAVGDLWIADEFAARGGERRAAHRLGGEAADRQRVADSGSADGRRMASALLGRCTFLAIRYPLVASSVRLLSRRDDGDAPQRITVISSLLSSDGAYDDALYLCDRRCRFLAREGHRGRLAGRHPRSARPQGQHGQAGSVHQRRSRHDEPVPARRSVRHDGRHRDRPRSRPLRALRAHDDVAQQQFHDRPHLRARHRARNAAATTSARRCRSSRTSPTRSSTASAWAPAMPTCAWSRSAARSATSSRCRSSRRSASWASSSAATTCCTCT